MIFMLTENVIWSQTVLLRVSGIWEIRLHDVCRRGFVVPQLNESIACTVIRPV